MWATAGVILAVVSLVFRAVWSLLIAVLVATLGAVAVTIGVGVGIALVVNPQPLAERSLFWRLMTKMVKSVGGIIAVYYTTAFSWGFTTMFGQAASGQIGYSDAYKWATSPLATIGRVVVFIYVLALGFGLVRLRRKGRTNGVTKMVCRVLPKIPMSSFPKQIAVRMFSAAVNSPLWLGLTFTVFGGM